jgi:hypothetical protein
MTYVHEKRLVCLMYPRVLRLTWYSPANYVHGAVLDDSISAFIL